jgi:lysophospholipase L1-like esterase
MEKHICVFGDSTSWGGWDLEKGGWVSRLWFYLGGRQEGDDIELYNCSISGGTSDTILARFESEAKIRTADVLIFQTGGNDASYKSSPDNLLVPEDRFRQNIEEIIKRAKPISNKIVFCDLKNCDESKTMPVPWADFYYRNEDMQKYCKIMEEICIANGVEFLDLDILDNVDFFDGLHPNEQGHEKIFQQVKKFLEDKKWI